MQEINIYTEKIGNDTFRSSDVPLLLKVLRHDSKAGLLELTKDDVHLFQVYIFTLQQLELSSGNVTDNVHSGDWREAVDDFSMLKRVIDEMEKNNVISKVAWNAGSMAMFDIPDKKKYKNYIYSLILGHLNKLYGRK